MHTKDWVSYIDQEKRRLPWFESLVSSGRENSVHFAFDPPSVSQAQGNDTAPQLSATTQSQAAKAISEASSNEELPGDAQGAELDKVDFSLLFLF